MIILSTSEVFSFTLKKLGLTFHADEYRRWRLSASVEEIEQRDVWDEMNRQNMMQVLLHRDFSSLQFAVGATGENNRST